MPIKPVPGGGGATPNFEYYSHQNNHGEYGYVNLDEVVTNFIAAYVGTGKILEGTKKGDVNYHAHRAFQELHYDTFKSCKSISITLPPSLIMVVPNDYVNYTKITWADDNGIERILYPTSKTSAPDKIQQDDDGNYLYGDAGQFAHSLLKTGFGGSSRLVLSLDDIDANSPVGTEFVVNPKNPHGYNDSVSPTSYTDGVNSTAYENNEIYENALKHPLEVGMEVFAPGFFPPGTKIASVTGPTNPTDTGSTFTFTTDKPSINLADYQNIPVTFKNYTDSTVWGKYKNAGSNTVGVDSSTTTNLAVDADNYFLNTGQRYGLDPQYAQANGSFFIDCKSGQIFFSSNLSGKTIVLHYISDGHGSSKELIVPKLAEEAMYKWIAYGCLSARADIPENVIQRYKKEKFAETRKAKIRLSNIKIEEIAQIMRGKSKFIDH